MERAGQPEERIPPPMTVVPPVVAPEPEIDAAPLVRKRSVTLQLKNASSVKEMADTVEMLYQQMAEVRERYVLRPEFNAALALKADASEPRRAIADLRDDLEHKAELSDVTKLLRRKVDQETFKSSVMNITKRQLGETMTSFKREVVLEAREEIDTRVSEALDFQVASVERMREVSAFVLRLDAMDVKLAQLLAGRDASFAKELKKVEAACDVYVNQMREIAQGNQEAQDAALSVITDEVASMQSTVEEVVSKSGQLEAFKSQVRTDMDMAVAQMNRKIQSALKQVQKSNEEESKAFDMLERRFESLRAEVSTLRQHTQRDVQQMQHKQQATTDLVERAVSEIRSENRKLKDVMEQALRHSSHGVEETRSIHRRLNKLDAKVQSAHAPMRSLDALKLKVARLPQQLINQGVVIPGVAPGTPKAAAAVAAAAAEPVRDAGGGGEFNLRSYEDTSLLEVDPPATGKEMDAVKERVSKLEAEYRKSLHRGVQTLDGLRDKLDTVSGELADTRQAASDMHKKVEDCTSELVNLKAENETLLFELARHQEQQREMHVEYTCLLSELRAIQTERASENWINPMEGSFHNPNPSRANNGNAAATVRAATASAATAARVAMKSSPLAPLASPLPSSPSPDLLRQGTAPNKFRPPRIRVSDRLNHAGLREENSKLRQQLYLARSPTSAGGSPSNATAKPAESARERKKQKEVQRLKARMAKTVQELASWDPEAAVTKKGSGGKYTKMQPAAYPHLPDMSE